jgi:hypothetical protein
MHPYIREMLAQRDAWLLVPQPRKEPFTLDMFQALSQFLCSKKDWLDTFLSKESVVFDWARLGLFNGSQVSD